MIKRAWNKLKAAVDFLLIPIQLMRIRREMNKMAEAFNLFAQAV